MNGGSRMNNSKLETEKMVVMMKEYGWYWDRLYIGNRSADGKV